MAQVTVRKMVLGLFQEMSLGMDLGLGQEMDPEKVLVMVPVMVPGTAQEMGHVSDLHLGRR